MPCNSEYMEPKDLEIECGRMFLLLDELHTGTPVDPDEYKRAGYDDRAYYKSNRELADKLARRLCTALKQLGDVSGYSLELQMWWRDHQEADRIRNLKEE